MADEQREVRPRAGAWIETERQLVKLAGSPPPPPIVDKLLPLPPPPAGIGLCTL